LFKLACCRVCHGVQQSTPAGKHTSWAEGIPFLCAVCGLGFDLCFPSPFSCGRAASFPSLPFPWETGGCGHGAVGWLAQSRRPFPVLLCGFRPGPLCCSACRQPPATQKLPSSMVLLLWPAKECR